MGKSKKTLALVMALVMAFTIVPFGAWYGFKAAAEDTSAHAATDVYVPAKELIKGQEYVIAGKTADGRYYAISQKSNESSRGLTVNAQTFDPATGFNDTALEYRSTWTYDYSDSGNGWLYHPTNLFTDPSDDGNAYIDVNETKSDFGVYAYRNNGEEKHILNTASSEGDGKFALNFTRNKTAYYIELVDQDGGQWFRPTTTRTPLYIFEKSVDAPETITFPIKIRDMHADGLLVDMMSPESVFALSGNSGNNVAISNKGGHVNQDFLKLLSEIDNTQKHGFRKNLTQSELKDGKLQYSPYTVIYVAHALREHYYVSARDYRKPGNFSFKDTPLTDALRDKYTGNRPDAGGYTDKKPEAKEDSSFEGELFKGNIDSFITALANGDTRNKVDAFFAACGKDSYATYDDAKTAAMNATGLSEDNAKILADYAYTISHADKLTYQNIVNGNPAYDINTKSINVRTWETTFNAPIIWDGQTSKLGWGKYEVQGTPTFATYNEYGASFMDVAWYMLHHFFEDTAEEDIATSLVGKTSNNEINFQYFSKTVENSANYLELKRIVRDDGSITYLYDSAYNSTWGDANTPIKNVGINQMNYNGEPSASSANFCPIDNKGFLNSHSNGHNYGFSLQGSGKFVYDPTQNLYFEFNGDDDVFLYINNKRVDSVDLGGTHGPVTGRVNLNDIADEFGLNEDGVYDFDFFYMERNPVGANLRIETNIRVIDTGLFAEKKAVKDGKEIPSGAGVKDGEKIYYAISAMNYGATIGGADASAVSNVVLDDSAIGNVKISKDGVIGVNAADVRFVLSTYNESAQTWTDTELANYDAAKTYFASLDPGKKITALVPYTVDASSTGKSFDNNLYVTAEFATSTGSTEKLNPKAHHNLQIFDIADKTMVVDFAGTLEYDADKLFSNDELRDYEYNDTISVKRTVDNTSALRLNDDGSADYTVKNFMSKPEVVTVNEAFYFGSAEAPASAPYYTTTKTITFVPANNVYYDDSFNGITYDGLWRTQTHAGAVLNGISGTDVIYGNTNESVEFTQDSHYITGGGEGQYAKATFTFTGEGYTMYMDTNAQSGSIMVRTQKLNDKGEAEGKAKLDLIKITSTEDFKNVPVVNRINLDGYGTYKVEVSASMPGNTYASLTGIRVYNPMGNQDTTGIYVDTEKNASFIELRDNIVNASDVLKDQAINGVLYIDGNGSAATIADYAKDGPKNEIYLAKDQAVAFAITGLNADSKVQVSARSLKGDATAVNGTAIDNTLDMYYNIEATDGVYVIRNTGDGVLALTNLKITNASNATPVVSKSIAEKALAVFNAPAPVEPEVPEVPEEPETPSKPQNPIVKFFENVKNFFNKIFGRH